MANPAPTRGRQPARETFDNLADNLAGPGFWIGRNLLPTTLVDALRAEVGDLARSNALRRAGIGRGTDYRVDENQRNDLIHWLARTTLPRCLFLDAMETLRRELNRRLFLGLFEFEAHFALYPPGGGYRRHVDSFRGAASRTVSVVVYLNHAWRATDRGELVIYEPHADGEAARVRPRAGTVAVFLSEKIPHEVLPARRARASIAGWFRVNASHADASDPPG